MGVGEPLYRRVKSSVSAWDADVQAYTGLAALLTALLVFVVPAGAVLFDAPVRLLLVGAVVLYAMVSVATDGVFEGTFVAFVVVAVFNTRAPSPVPLPGLSVHHHRVVVVLAVAVLVLLYRRGALRWGWFDRPDRKLVVGGFAAFVVWAWVALLVGNGPERSGALWHVNVQLRYLLVLVLAGVVVDRTDARSVLAPVAFALAGTLVFAVDEVFAGRGGYLVNFGTLGGDIAAVWPSPSLTTFARGGTILYEAGAFGQNRTMVGLAIVFIPLALAAATRSRRYVPLALASGLGLISVIASGSHAAIIGLYGGLLPVLVYVAYLAFDRAGMARARRLVVPVSVLATVLAVAVALGATAAGYDRILFVRTNNLSIRLGQYQAAIDIVSRYPLFGVGGGRNVRLVANSVVHNLFLQHLAATGLPGGFAYLVSTGTATYVCLRRCLAGQASERWLWVGVLGGILGFYAYGFWVVAYRWELLNAAHWLLVGVVVGAGPCDMGRPADWLGDGYSRVADRVRAEIRSP